jgi:hypothetical protein
MNIFQCDLCKKQFIKNGDPKKEIVLNGTFLVKFEYTGVGTNEGRFVAEVCPDCKDKVEAFILCKPINISERKKTI